MAGVGVAAPSFDYLPSPKGVLMTHPVHFLGCNRTFLGDGESILDIEIFDQPDGPCKVLKVQLTPHEIEQVQRDGCVWVSQMTPPNVYVPIAVATSESDMKLMVAQYGDIWYE